ncbi:hypothetical protein DM02DRAFT_267830 [Periconia macrospinosa]|uniref:Uncharacterized protein n=1 Tax=Periconia macrospinosa TaxID=97972 RepID=A0A2V1DYV8_9PLEO|nr:hypothetical protein DM02DRAFT_267830 [Periconia macrospinosa]
MDAHSEDLVRATISSQHPRFPPPDLSKNPLAPFLLSSIWRQEDATTQQRKSFASQLSTFLQTARNLSAYQESLRRPPTESLAIFNQKIAHFAQVCISFEHRLLILEVPSPSTTYALTREDEVVRMGLGKFKELLHRVVHIAFKLYTVAVFRDLQSNYNMVQTLQTDFQHLKEALVSVPMGERSVEDKHLLLWALWVIGSTMQASLHTDQHECVILVKALLLDLEINKWSEMRVILSGVLWSVRMQKKRCLDLCVRYGLLVAPEEVSDFGC